jgi:hypothetical protein
MAIVLLFPVTLGLGRPQLAPPVLCREREAASQSHSPRDPGAQLGTLGPRASWKAPLGAGDSLDEGP